MPWNVGVLLCLVYCVLPMIVIGGIGMAERRREVKHMASSTTDFVQRAIDAEMFATMPMMQITRGTPAPDVSVSIEPAPGTWVTPGRVYGVDTAQPDGDHTAVAVFNYTQLAMELTGIEMEPAIDPDVMGQIVRRAEAAINAQTDGVWFGPQGVRNVTVPEDQQARALRLASDRANEARQRFESAHRLALPTEIQMNLRHARREAEAELRRLQNQPPVTDFIDTAMTRWRALERHSVAWQDHHAVYGLAEGRQPNNPTDEKIWRVVTLYGGTWEFNYENDRLQCWRGPLTGAFFTRAQVEDNDFAHPHLPPGGTGGRQIAQLPVRKEHRDEQGRFHCEDGPALVLENGMQHWFWHGLECNGSVILCPETITIDNITRDLSKEYVRAMLARYRTADQTRDLSGAALFVQDCIAKDLAEEVDHNEPIGTLWCVDLDCGMAVNMVEVVNRTANPDGTFTHYWRRVPSDLFSARAAVAWTWGLEASEYKPVAES